MRKKRHKIGLALSGGLARGLAHIGVLKTFENHNIPIDCVSGTSMGAVIGGLYCGGMSPEMIEELVLNTKWHTLFNFAIPKNYLVRKYGIRGVLRKQLHQKSFSELKHRLFVSATKLKSGEKVVFD